MSNPYFRFKQFTINQQHCAMKVCTDACLFGAWVAQQKQTSGAINNVLDIGAGTGLLSMMLAQKIEATIDAVEIDNNAAMQAMENFKASPWHKRLTCYNTSIEAFAKSKTYDLIISNPPFFAQSLQSEDNLKNLAKHATGLTIVKLADIVINLLNPSGAFCILLPPYEFDKFVAMASAKQLYVRQRMDVKQTPSHAIFRSMGIFYKDPSHRASHKTMIIKDEHNQYTQAFTELLKDYYLHL